MSSEFGYIKNKYYAPLAKVIDKACDAKIKELVLYKDEFEWMKKHFKHPENVKEFIYRGVKIVKY